MAKKAVAVWIVNEGGHSYEEAKVYGHLVSLTKDRINPFRPDRLALEISKKLKGASSDDYLLLSGPPIVNALAMILWLERFGTINVLIHSHREGGSYEVKTLKLERLVELATEDLS